MSGETIGELIEDAQAAEQELFTPEIEPEPEPEQATEVNTESAKPAEQGTTITVDGKTVFAVGDTATEKCRDAIRKLGFATIEEARQHHKTITQAIGCSKGVYYNAINSLDWEANNSAGAKAKVPTVGYQRPEPVEIIEAEPASFFTAAPTPTPAPTAPIMPLMPQMPAEQAPTIESLKKVLTECTASATGNIISIVSKKRLGIDKNVMTDKREEHLGVLLPCWIGKATKNPNLTVDDYLTYATGAFIVDIIAELGKEKMTMMEQTFKPKPEPKPEPQPQRPAQAPAPTTPKPEPKPEPKEEVREYRQPQGKPDYFREL